MHICIYTCVNNIKFALGVNKEIYLCKSHKTILLRFVRQTPTVWIYYQCFRVMFSVTRFSSVT